MMQFDMHVLADPLNWPVPEPRIANAEIDPHLRCAECDVIVSGMLTLHAYRKLAYILHYYREHAYRNWSA